MPDVKGYHLAALLACACTAANPAYRTHEDAAMPMDHAGTARGDASVDQAQRLEGPALDGTADASAVAPLPDADPPDRAPVTDAAPGLAARWRLDPGAGTAVPDDEGTNDGTLGPGATWSTDTPAPHFDDGGSLQLDGMNSSVTLGTRTLPGFEQPKSISFWFWVSDAPTAVRKSIVTLASPATRQSIQLGLELGVIAAWGWSSPIGQAFLVGPTAVTAGWHHVGYTYDGKQHTLYVRGAAVHTSDLGFSPGPIPEALLGTYNVAADTEEHFQGRIDDVRIYDRALDANEMAALAAGAP